MAAPDDHWPEALGRAGVTVTAGLGAGMDGIVYALADGGIAKVWFRQSPATLAPLRTFYAELDAAGLPFATPRIDEILLVDGVPVTLERRLTGRPLSEFVRGDSLPPERAMRTFVAVLAELRQVGALPGAAALPVMDEPGPFRRVECAWSDSLTALVDRRVDAFGHQLRAAVDGFDALLAGVRAGLAALPGAGEPGAAPETVLHGDLCPPNLLVDDDLRVVSVLDWGYLTTAGDPAFDASLAAGFFDMYGPHARTVDDQLSRWIVDELGATAERLHLYRATYAIIGANAYDPAGADGHFAWCVDQLRRSDLRASLG